MCKKLVRGARGKESDENEKPVKRCSALKDKTICLLLLVKETGCSLRIQEAGH